jgi:hypothetical protein
VFLVIGCVLGAGYVLTGRVPHPDRALPAQVELSWARAGDLMVSPVRQEIATAGIMPGLRGVSGDLSLRNPTGVPLGVRPRAMGGRTELDDVLLVRVSAGGRRVYNGNLATLRRLRARPFGIPAGSWRRVRVSARLPRGTAADGYEGRAARVRLEWRTTPRGS